MAQSEVDACNSALQKLGAAPIMSLSDNSREARQCVIAFDSNRRSELRKHRWKFATKRVTLAPNATAPDFGYAYQYQLPVDCLRVLLPRDATSDWVVEGRMLLSNDGPVLYLRYIADITDVTRWDANFYDMFAISLAIDMCEAITNSAAKKQAIATEYREAQASAYKNDSFEQLPMAPPDDTLWLVRL